MKKLVFAVVAAMVVVAEAETTTYTWDGVSTAYGETVSVAYDGDGKVTELTASVPKDDKVVFIGDAAEFAADARIRIADGGQFVFSNDVVTAGALTVDGCVTNQSFLFAEQRLTPGNSLVLPSNFPLTALKPTGGAYSYNNDKTTYPNTGKPTIGAYFVHLQEDGSKTFQVQHDDGGTLRVTYCKIEEVADGLKVTVLKYLSRTSKFETRINGVYDYETPEGKAFIGNSGSGGALKALALTAQYVRGMRTVEFAGKLTAGGKISAANDAEIILGREAIGTEFATPYDVTMGTMTFRDYGSFTNAATVTGTNGGIVYETGDFTGDFTADDYIATKSYEEILSPDDNGLPSTETVVFPNTSLAMITNVHATINWRYYASNSSHQSDGVSRDLRAAEFVRFDTFAIAQFKAIPPGRGSVSYAVIVRFDQRGNDVVARKAKGYLCWHSTNPVSNDPWTWPLDCTGIGGYDKKWAHIWNLTAYSATPVGHADVTSTCVELLGSNSTENVNLTVQPGLNRDTMLIARQPKSLPSVKGEIHVWDRGTLSLHADVKTSDYRLTGIFVQENPVSLNFHPGARGLTLRETNNSSKQVINLDGAEYFFWRGNTGDLTGSDPNYKLPADSFYNFVGALNLSNGARTTGSSPWISGLQNPAVSAAGQAPSASASGFAVAFESKQCALAVDDVTQDGQVDLSVGLLRASTIGVSQSGLRKTGAGTMLFTKSGNNVGGLPFSVEEGVLLLGADCCLKGDPPVTLAGGTLGFAAGTINTNESLTVTADSSLALADGATAVFGDSSAQEWTPGTRLTVTGDPATSRVVFGENGLTDAQLRQIRWMVGGKANHVQLGDEGELVPYLPGLMLLIK